MCNCNPVPSVSPLRHLPPNYLHTLRHQSLGNDNPYASRRLKNRPQCRSVKGGQEGKGKDRESKRGFHRISFPLSPRDRSTSVGVLGKDRDKSKPNGEGDFKDAGNLAGGKGAGSIPDGARIAGLHFNGLLQDRRRAAPTTANELIPIFGKISSQHSPIIPSTSRLIPLVAPERILVCYVTLLPRPIYRT